MVDMLTRHYLPVEATVFQELGVARAAKGYIVANDWDGLVATLDATVPRDDKNFTVACCGLQAGAVQLKQIVELFAFALRLPNVEDVGDCAAVHMLQCLRERGRSETKAFLDAGNIFEFLDCLDRVINLDECEYDEIAIALSQIRSPLHALHDAFTAGATGAALLNQCDRRRLQALRDGDLDKQLVLKTIPQVAPIYCQR